MQHDLPRLLQLKAYGEPHPREVTLLAKEPPPCVVPLVMQKQTEGWLASPLWGDWQSLDCLLHKQVVSTKTLYAILEAICHAAKDIEAHLLLLDVLPLRYAHCCFIEQGDKIRAKLLVLPQNLTSPVLEESEDLMLFLNRWNINTNLGCDLSPFKASWQCGDFISLAKQLELKLAELSQVELDSVPKKKTKTLSPPKSNRTTLSKLFRKQVTPITETKPRFLADDETEKTKPLEPDVNFHLACLSDAPPAAWNNNQTNMAYILVDEFTIGRDSHKADFVLPNLTVSKRHATIKWHGGYYFLEDDGSKNGTWVNDKRISQHQEVLLPEACRLRFGNACYYFHTDSFLNDACNQQLPI